MTEKTTFREHIVQDRGVCPQCPPRTAGSVPSVPPVSRGVCPQCPFDDACAVIVFNDGTAETIPAKELTYARIYRRAFKGPPLLGYLTVRGFVEPKGVDK